MSSGKDKKKVRLVCENCPGTLEDETGTGPAIVPVSTGFDRTESIRSPQLLYIVPSFSTSRAYPVASFFLSFSFSPYLLVFLLRPSRSIVFFWCSPSRFGAPHETNKLTPWVLYYSARRYLLYYSMTTHNECLGIWYLYFIVLYFMLCCVFTIC